jgi:hypothetical protein
MKDACQAPNPCIDRRATFAAAFRNSRRILPFDITKLVQLPAGFERALRYEL